MKTKFVNKDDVRPYSVVVVPSGQPENHVRKQPTKGKAGTTSAWLNPGETRAVILERPKTWTKAYPYEKEGCLWVRIYADRAKGSGSDGEMDVNKEFAVTGWTAAAELNSNGTIVEWYLQPIVI